MIATEIISELELLISDFGDHEVTTSRNGTPITEVLMDEENNQITLGD